MTQFLYRGRYHERFIREGGSMRRLRFPRGIADSRGDDGQYGIVSNTGNGERRVQKHPRICTQLERFHNRGECLSNASFQLSERFIERTVENGGVSREFDGDDACVELEGRRAGWREKGGFWRGWRGWREGEREGVGGEREGWWWGGGVWRGETGDGGVEAGEGREGRFGDAGLERADAAR